MSLPTVRKTALAGAAVLAAYLAMAAWGTGGLLVRPLYDGTQAPPPYMWVNPPEDLKEGNEPPAGASETVRFVDGESEAFSVQTPDGQASVTMPPNAVVPKAGETMVRVTIVPLDPEKIGKPPEEVQYDGNAYDFGFEYETSKEVAPLVATECPPPNSGRPSQCISVALRHPISANALFRRDGERWAKLDVLSAPFQLFGDSTQAGIFVAAGPKPKEPSKAGDYVAIGAGIGATLIAIVAGRVIPKRRRAKARAAALRARGRGGPKGKRK